MEMNAIDADSFCQYAEEQKSSIEDSVIIVRKYGGAGSGFHGHASHPGEIGGSRPGGGLTAKVLAVEKDILRKSIVTGHEVGAFLDRKGILIFEKEGQEECVISFSAKERAKVRNAAVYTHTHLYPKEDITLSQADINFAVCMNLGEMRAVSETMVCSLKPGNKGWLGGKDIEHVLNKQGDNYVKSWNRIERLVVEGKIKRENLLFHAAKLNVETFAKEMSWKYRVGNLGEFTAKESLNPISSKEMERRVKIVLGHNGDFILDKSLYEKSKTAIKRKLNQSEIGDWNITNETYEDFDEEIEGFSNITIVRHYGGKGSGFHGHKGRPGEVGGSGPGSAPGFKGTQEQLRAEAKRRGIYLSPGEPVKWLAADPKGDCQAITVSKAGKDQYRYSAAYSAKAQAEKYTRLKDFHGVLDKMQKCIDKDFDKHDEAKVLSLIAQTGFRVGSNKKSLSKVKAYGASTLEAKHCSVKGDKINFLFTGKKGVTVNTSITDSRLAKHIGRVKSGPIFDTNYKKIRSYMKEVGGKSFTPKDLRTYVGTATALKAIAKMTKPKTQSDFKKYVKTVCESVAKQLHNTPAIAKKAYISPEVWCSWNPIGAYKFEDDNKGQRQCC